MDFTESILGKPFIDEMLASAKRDLEQGSFESQLVIKLDNFQVVGLELTDFNYTDNQFQRRAILAAIGHALRTNHHHIQEAVMLGGGWIVSGQEPGVGIILPSQHPARQEAITIMGRNSDKTRETSVIQPFTRNRHHKIEWSELCIAEYNRSVTDQNRMLGIFDALFVDDLPHAR